jgi:glutathione S-transferase
VTKLYFAPGACSLSPHIVLREAGLPFDLESVGLKAKKLKNGADYYPINPKGQVPLLALDDGEGFTEGPAIVQYIADRAPASGLIPPAGSKERYRTQERLNFISSELHKNFSRLFRPNTPDDSKPIAKDNLASRFASVEQAPFEPSRSGRRQVHGGACLSVHHPQMGKAPVDRSEAVAEFAQIYGARGRTPKSEGPVAGGGAGLMYRPVRHPIAPVEYCVAT